MRKECRVCGSERAAIASVIGVCGSCLKEGSPEAAEAARRAHHGTRAWFGLPLEPPRTNGGVSCTMCSNECLMGEGEIGYCGLRGCEAGRLVQFAGTARKGAVEWYHDPLPTNCVAGWACAATGCGYPAYSYREGPERGYNNLAVFYDACSFDCLFCQNWHFRSRSPKTGYFSAAELAAAVRDDTACVCFFGGDPGPQLAHALRTSEMAREHARDRILRICWETNGNMNEALLDKMLELSTASGGCVKFDLKAWNDNLHVGLAGVSNRRTLSNFARAAEATRGRRVPPPLVASTLLVPGYVDREEVAAIAAFIASLDEEIPYSLLAFHPDYAMRDLPTTGRREAGECLAAARSAGLKNVHCGNVHLLKES